LSALQKRRLVVASTFLTINGRANAICGKKRTNVL
jgi:hypothetical protein